MKNRDGYTYEWMPLGNNRYLFVMDEEVPPYWRMGGLEEGEGIGFFDPPGGPFVQVGGYLYGKVIRTIESTEDGIVVEVKNGY